LNNFSNPSFGEKLSHAFTPLGMIFQSPLYTLVTVLSFLLFLVLKALPARRFKYFRRGDKFTFKIKSFAAIRGFRIPRYIKENTFPA
jgi:hypothetical protein